jgi:hypothetical protein
VYELERKKEFIVIKGSDIIDVEETTDICDQVTEMLAEAGGVYNLLVDVRDVKLKESKFDAFINYLTKVKLNKIALVLSDLISGFKFKFWRRKYQGQVKIEQFDKLDKAQAWLES